MSGGVSGRAPRAAVVPVLDAGLVAPELHHVSQKRQEETCGFIRRPTMSPSAVVGGIPWQQEPRRPASFSGKTKPFKSQLQRLYVFPKNIGGIHQSPLFHTY